MGNLTTALFPAAVVATIGYGAYLHIDKALENMSDHVLETQEHFDAAPRSVAQTPVRDDVDCGRQADGSFQVVSGGEVVPNATASFMPVMLPNAVEDAKGSCDVTVTDEAGNEIDSYRVNAYEAALVGPFNFRY
ncbi:MAG: hypothetical protein AAGB32_03395 [Pseudomonadota bacterium]